MSSLNPSVNHTEEVAIMNKTVEELHNVEDATTLRDSILFFLGITLLLCILGLMFWSAF
jgi:hypothetical protein